MVEQNIDGELDKILTQMTDIFKAIADPTRREILMMVVQEPTNVNTIAEKFNMSRPAVSKHLKILEDNGLLFIQNSDIDGRQRNCYVQLGALKEIEDKKSAYKEKLYKDLGFIATFKYLGFKANESAARSLAASKAL